MGRFSRLGNDLYTGRKSYDFVGRRALWYSIALGVVGLAIVTIAIKGLNFGIEFTGGTQYRVDNLAAEVATQETADELRGALADSGVGGAAESTVSTSGDDAIIIQMEELSTPEDQEVRAVIVDITGAAADDISQDQIGASWGRDVAERAILGVAIFLALVVLFIGLYFREWKMAIAGVVALIHDVVITIGVYSFSGFPVTPAAVTGLLAILGFSMYDTVVVFDKVRENTHEMHLTRLTYAQSANLAVNQTLVRSINTSIVALIPIGAILYVSAVMLPSSALKDLALAQFVGMAVGIYSSVFIAPRLLVHLKSSESDIVLADRRAKARARKAADKYASVPAFTDDLPIAGEPDEIDDDADGTGYEVEEPATDPREPRSAEVMGKGRNTPTAPRPVTPSAASGRQQPSRQPKSKRGKN